ncbi:hypothetical protein F383_34896 [Gossypium arboreum]|uniref:Uncharacterized protein n=1 Tax=Gossypium arboreum TaxID=29729 RepID=A0A0B0N594_GOSAR|nr:hypothetical protein F383_34896 [Gossypium arboreum]
MRLLLDRKIQLLNGSGAR